MGQADYIKAPAYEVQDRRDAGEIVSRGADKRCPIHRSEPAATCRECAAQTEARHG